MILELGTGAVFPCCLLNPPGTPKYIALIEMSDPPDTVQISEPECSALASRGGSYNPPVESLPEDREEFWDPDSKSVVSPLHIKKQGLEVVGFQGSAGLSKSLV